MGSGGGAAGARLDGRSAATAVPPIAAKATEERRKLRTTNRDP